MLWKKTSRITPAQIIILGFLFLILAGALLLTLPFASRQPGSASFWDALFTATSATCVTGLVIYDTATFWSPFGQFVIMILIQIGGMGVVTMAIAITMFAGKRIGLKQRWVMQESISAPQVGGIVRMTGFILKAGFILEATGALLLAVRFIPQLGILKGLWYAVFHSVSAFCNAGFDLMGYKAPFSSLTASVGDPIINFTVMGLIVLGGIGFLTWHDFYEHKWHFRRFRMQSKLILVTTFLLILLPALFFFLYEFHLPQWEGLTLGQRIQAALFQSITPRTAGFNTVDLTLLSQSSTLVIILLMLIGGSPGSTAGGFKTTTLAVLLLTIRAVFHRRECAQCFGRRIPADVLRSAVTIFLLYCILFLAGGIFLCCFDGLSMMEALFETASAIGTVGLSLGVTPTLSFASRLVLIFLMYFGRVGGLTLLYAVASGSACVPAQLPQERLTVG